MLYRFLLLVAVALTTKAYPAISLPAFTRNERVVVIAPHPDDEALATGGAIQQALAAGADVRVIYLTNGDHNQIAFKLASGSLFMTGKGYRHFGEKRLTEAVNAMSALGLREQQLTFFGYPDWGLQQLWRDYWHDAKPFRSDATRVSTVPYRDAYSYNSPYRPESLLDNLETLLAEFRPTKLFVPHPADTNPDHRAAANFVRLALLNLPPGAASPLVYYYVVHFGDWPKPYHYHPEETMTPPARLRNEGQWHSLSLTPDQTAAKYNAILQNKSQLTTRQFYLVAFARANELFATLPAEQIISLPSDAIMDWRRAVRNRALAINPDPGKSGEPSCISLKETELLRQGDDLIVAIDFHSRLGRRSNVHLFLYGYRRGADFAALPKIHININPLNHLRVYDDDRKSINEHGITKIIMADKIILWVPLSLLGGGGLDHIFTATRANLGAISADDTAWELYALPPANAPMLNAATTKEPHG